MIHESPLHFLSAISVLLIRQNLITFVIAQKITKFFAINFLE